VATVWPLQFGMGERGMAVGKRGVPKVRREILKDQESRERRKEHAREAKARNATNMDKHVLQAYKVALCYMPLHGRLAAHLGLRPAVSDAALAGAGSRRGQEQMTAVRQASAAAECA
jgi:hypothetical protein